MTILYSQIQSLPDLKILTGTFSIHGQYIEDSNLILKELQEVIKKTPSKTDEFFNYKCNDNKSLFFIKIEKSLIYSCLTDTTTSEEVAIKYFTNISTIFTKIYTPLKSNYSGFNNELKESTNKFNKDSNYIEIGVNLEKTKEYCVLSLNQVMKRGENIEKMTVLADKLKFASDELKKRSSQMYLDTLVSQYGLYLVIVLVLFILFYFLFGR